MKLVIAEGQKQILESLTQAIRFCQKRLASKGFSLDIDDWAVKPADTLFGYEYKNKNKNGLLRESKKLGNLNINFYIAGSEQIVHIYTHSFLQKPLLKDSLEPQNLRFLLARELFKNSGLTFSQYKEIYERVPSMPKIDELGYILTKWIGASNYQETVKLGEKLEMLEKYISKEFLKVPSNKLYRVVAIKQNLFNKVLNDNKSFALHNRKYSSWTYSSESALRFGDYVRRNKLRDKDIIIIIERNVLNEDVILNVQAFAEFLSEKKKFWRPALAREEKEIIVRNKSKSFRVGPSDIFLWYDENQNKWFKL